MMAMKMRDDRQRTRRREKNSRNIVSISFASPFFHAEFNREIDLRAIQSLRGSTESINTSTSLPLRNKGKRIAIHLDSRVANNMQIC